MPDLSDLLPIHSGQDVNFNLLVLGQVQNLYKVNKLCNIYFDEKYEFTCCIENSVDPDQNCLSTEWYKLICTIGQVKFLWTSTFWPFTCPWTSRKFYYFHTPGSAKNFFVRADKCPMSSKYCGTVPLKQVIKSSKKQIYTNSLVHIKWDIWRTN